MATENYLIDCMLFNVILSTLLSYISAASSPIHAFLESLRKIFFRSHWLLFDINRCRNNGQRWERNHPVVVFIVNPRKKMAMPGVVSCPEPRGYTLRLWEC